MVGDAALLHSLAGMSPGTDRTNLVAQPAHLTVHMPCPAAGGDLVGPARQAIEVEDALEAQRQAPIPVARQVRPLVPHISTARCVVAG